MAIDQDFAQYCCELLRSAGPCVSKRMFGGFGISVDGLSIAIIADLGAGEKLWLKGDEASRSQYNAAGCAMFIYDAKGTPRSMNYFSAPEEAMDSADAMRPWATLALQCAVRAQAAKRKPTAKPSANTTVKSATKSTPTSATNALATTQTGTTQAGTAPSKLSQTVLARARETAIQMAASKSLPAAKPSKPAAKRATAPVPSTTAKRKSAKGAKTAAQ